MSIDKKKLEKMYEDAVETLDFLQQPGQDHLLLVCHYHNVMIFVKKGIYAHFDGRTVDVPFQDKDWYSIFEAAVSGKMKISEEFKELLDE